MCSSNKTSTNKDKKSNAKLEQKYTDNSYLINPETLSKNLKKENLLIIDTRSKKEYKKGWGEDGRIVWMLRMAGLNNSKMLNGGFTYWENNDFKISKDSKDPKKSNFKIENLDKKTYADTDWTKNNINKIKILDTREQKEYDGSTDFGEARGGHLPKSKLFTFNKVFNDDGTFKSEKKIKDMLSKEGINKDDQILTYCTAGIRSAHLALVLQMVGYNNVKNYDGSFYRWATQKDLKLEK